MNESNEIRVLPISSEHSERLWREWYGCHVGPGYERPHTFSERAHNLLAWPVAFVLFHFGPVRLVLAVAVALGAALGWGARSVR